MQLNGVKLLIKVLSKKIENVAKYHFSRIGNELITAESVCNGNEATPNIPPAEFGYIFGWSAALFSSNMEKVKNLKMDPK